MFCSNCGKEIADGSNFCPGCGAKITVNVKPQQAASQPVYSAPKQPVYTAPRPAYNAAQQTQAPAQKPKEKKKTSLGTRVLVGLVVAFIAYTIGSKVIAPAMVSDSAGTSSGASNSSVSSGSTTPNPEYEEIFTSRYIVDSPAMFFNLESASYATVYDSGMVYKIEYGYNADIVEAMCMTFYVPVSDLDDTQKSELEGNFQELYASLENLSFCTVKYNMGATFYRVTITVTDLDDSSNVEKLIDAELFPEGSATTLRMTVEDEALLADGFVKK